MAAFRQGALDALAKWEEHQRLKAQQAAREQARAQDPPSSEQPDLSSGEGTRPDSAFVTPTDNIACNYQNDFEIWCYVRSSRTLAVVNRSGAGRWAYAKRGVSEPPDIARLHGPVLQYGATWENAGSSPGVIRCVSRTTGLSCFNLFGVGNDTGFVASREAVRVRAP
jgi:hypothetical protein